MSIAIESIGVIEGVDGSFLPLAGHSYEREDSYGTGFAVTATTTTLTYTTTNMVGGGAGLPPARGSFTLTGGASGSVGSILVQGVNVLTASIPYDTSLAQTAADIAANINAAQNNYYAVVIGNTVYIYATERVGSAYNGYVVASTETTMNITDANFSNTVNEVQATGSVTLTGGASGSINTVTVNGVDILGASVPYTTSLSNTANLVAAQINAYQTNYIAIASGATVTLYATIGLGTSVNGHAVAATSTTLTTSTVNMSGGVNYAPATGNIQIAGGSGGSLDTLTINGVSVIPGAIPFNTSHEQTAQDIAAAVSGYQATYVAVGSDHYVYFTPNTSSSYGVVPYEYVSGSFESMTLGIVAREDIPEFLPMVGYAGEYGAPDGTIVGNFEPMTVTVYEGIEEPEITAVIGAFPGMTGTGVEFSWVIDSGSGSFRPLAGFASEVEHGQAIGSFEPMTGFVFETPSTYAYISGSVPAATLTAYASLATPNVIRGVVPPATLTASTGATTRKSVSFGTVQNLVVPLATLSASATVAIIGTASLTVPRATLTASATVGSVAHADLIGPKATLSAYSGGKASVTVRIGATLTASASMGVVARASLRVPRARLTASATVGYYEGVDGVFPTMTAGRRASFNVEVVL